MNKGGIIVVHTSYKSLGGVEGGAETVIDVMRELVGPKGTVLFPAFNFQSWTETHYFDVLETPSKMGMITELARLRPDAKRTPHPIYSFLRFGRACGRVFQDRGRGSLRTELCVCVVPQVERDHHEHRAGLQQFVLDAPLHRVQCGM